MKVLPVNFETFSKKVSFTIETCIEMITTVHHPQNNSEKKRKNPKYRKEISFMVENGRFMMDSERGLISKINEKEIAIDMKVPAKVCGMLIGGGGEKVQEIMLVTGAEIWVERDNTTHNTS